MKRITVLLADDNRIVKGVRDGSEIGSEMTIDLFWRLKLWGDDGALAEGGIEPAQVIQSKHSISHL